MATRCSRLERKAILRRSTEGPALVDGILAAGRRAPG